MSRDRDSYVKANAIEILKAKRPEFEAQQAAFAAALDHLRQAIDAYISDCQDASVLLAAAGRDRRVPGGRVPGMEEASILRRSLRDVEAPPVPIPEQLEEEAD